MPYNTADGLYQINTANEEAPAQVFPVMCLKCGVRFLHDLKGMDIHTKWHEDYDELIDWARSVSNLFKRTPEQPHELNSGGLSEENRGIAEASIKDRFNMGGSEEGLQKGSD